MPPQLVDFGSRGRKSDAFVVTILIAALAGEDIDAKPACSVEPGIRLRGDRRGDAPWQDDHGNDAR
jgi:hypothetical protein